MSRHDVTPMSSLVKVFKKHEEPPEEAVALYAKHYSRLFDAIGYQRGKIKDFDRIPDFMARFQIATGRPLNAEFALYESELKGKQFDMPKGLLLYGPPGTGKTLAARIIKECLHLEMRDTHTIGIEYLKKGGEDWLHDFVTSYKKNAVIIDDICSEGNLKKYGNESPMVAIFTARARYWDTYGTPTIYTTNFTDPEKIAEFYGNDPRLLDRLTAYQLGVEFTGASLRK